MAQRRQRGNERKKKNPLSGYVIQGIVAGATREIIQALKEFLESIF